VDGAIPTFGNAATLFNLGRYIAGAGHDYDIAPKGDRFILTAPTVRAAGQIVVVENFFEELRRKRAVHTSRFYPSQVRVHVRFSGSRALGPVRRLAGTLPAARRIALRT
jgi:hypothetical protein